MKPTEKAEELVKSFFNEHILAKKCANEVILELKKDFSMNELRILFWIDVLKEINFIDESYLESIKEEIKVKKTKIDIQEKELFDIHISSNDKIRIEESNFWFGLCKGFNNPSEYSINDVSYRVIKVIQSYTAIVNRVIWNKA